MELTNEFDVAVPVERAWAVLTDLERIAPCLPGAELREVEGDEYRGVVKVRVGPITAIYQGAASFVERDEANHRAVLRAEGRESRGHGNAGATITATMAPSGSGTRVTVVTELDISGKVAQFGRGVLADVSAKLLDQFVASLEATVLASEAPGAAPGGEDAAKGAAGPDAEPSTGVRQIESAPAAPVNLLDVAGRERVRRVTRPLAAAVALAAAAALARRRRRRAGS
ncbi:MAG: SRPBCC family protein [Acidobacteriota bacterium]|nr:SRPBCC family protein [Acidobacteriota bacterium]